MENNKPNGITYRIVGDYKIPNLKFPDEENKPLGKWGKAHKDYLMLHKPVIFTMMISEGIIWGYLQEIDKTACEMFDELVKEMCANDNITEELKANDQMRWVQAMNTIYNRATEIVNHELIYT